MPSETIGDLLRDHRFFADLPAAAVDLIAGCGRNVHYAAGAIVFEEGQPADTFYVVRHGLIAVETHGPQQPAIVITTVGPGGVAGWSWLFPPYRWQFDGRAVEDTSAVALDGACLRAKGEADPELGYRLMRLFAALAVQRLQATRLQLLDLYGKPGEHGRAAG